ncbi:hypothetical protein [Desulfosporosinus nitroreducens]|uniref:Uncharacterized protein n=1 Tax=Desulfosporosinus nitroreducens TaxID=2018668 RepID=A0ABT8QUX4_9FIRM|nr:hypothetical protein [Desulfosporosinus nitroreducens]MDO0825158.1 hypothetical protein [Desulfosporosinus nitroreducens]
MPYGFAEGKLLDRREALIYNELEYVWEEKTMKSKYPVNGMQMPFDQG